MNWSGRQTEQCVPGPVEPFIAHDTSRLYVTSTGAGRLAGRLAGTKVVRPVVSSDGMVPRSMLGTHTYSADFELGRVTRPVGPQATPPPRRLVQPAWAPGPAL